jgi:hypothetical protein
LYSVFLRSGRGSICPRPREGLAPGVETAAGVCCRRGGRRRSATVGACSSGRLEAAGIKDVAQVEEEEQEANRHSFSLLRMSNKRRHCLSRHLLRRKCVLLGGLRTTMRHLTRELIHEFLACRLSRSDNMLVVRHMLARCPDCIPLQRALIGQHPIPSSAGGKLGKVA